MKQNLVTLKKEIVNAYDDKYLPVVEYPPFLFLVNRKNETQPRM